MVNETTIDKLLQSCGNQAGLAVKNRTIVETNQSFAELLGYLNPRDLIGTLLSDITCNNDILSAGLHHIPAITITGTIIDLEATTILWPDTTDVWLVLIRKCSGLLAPASLSNSNPSELISEYYKGIAEDQTDLIDRFLLDGTITYANQALCRYMNCTQEELMGRCLYDFLPDEDRLHLLDVLSTITRENPVTDFIHQVNIPGCEIRMMHWTDRGIFDSEGRLVEYLAIGQDITEAHQTSEALANSERLFRAAFENAGVGMLLVTPDGECIKCNRYAQVLSGYTADEMNLFSSRVLNPNDGSCVIADLPKDSIASKEETIQVERRCTNKSGDDFWARISISAVRDDDKKLVYVIAALEDITNYRNALNSLQEAEQFSRTVIQAAGESIIVYNKDMNIRVWNRRIEETTGIISAEAIGRSIFDVLPFTANDPNICFFYDALEGIETRNAELIYERPGVKHKEYVEMTFSPHYNSTGDVIGVIQLARSITAAKQSEAELLKAMQELENAYKLQAIFLNNVMHDVRTPLTAIQGYVKMLLEGVAGEISEFQSQLLQKVLVSSDQLLEMVNSMLEISKSRNSSLTLNPKVCKPDAILSRTVSSISPQAQEKGINLVFNRIDCGTGLYDQQKLTMILLNILGNAVKFTECGSIEVGITGLNDGVEIIVIDTGVGIEKDSLPNIFDDFVQLESVKKHKHPGFGLGLSIVANMIELMNGCLIVSSEEGIGTAFTILIPELDSI